MKTAWNPQAVALVNIAVQEGFGYYLVNLFTVLLEKAGSTRKEKLIWPFP